MYLHQRNSEQGIPSRNFLFIKKQKNSTESHRSQKKEIEFGMKKNDFMLILALCLLAAFLGIFYWLTTSDGDFVTVSINGEIIGSYPLNQDDVVEIRSESRENILVIENGKAFMRSANCPNGICCAHKPIFREGETIICYPHKVVVTIRTG